MAKDEKPLLPGWYEVPGTYNTLRYFDGDDFTGPTMPLQRGRRGPGVLVIARGVFLGTLAVGALGWAVASCEANQAYEECIEDDSTTYGECQILKPN